MQGASTAEGTVVKGKYRIERTLGVGGMGVVVAATHLQLGSRVAIKFLLPEMLKHPEIVERFLREARAASQIEGDHVARVTDVDTLDDGSPFLVMEYLDGRDLSFVRKERRQVPIGLVVGWVIQAASAIAEAHARGIVHRDLKPANLFLAQRHDGSTRIKVLDFGISKFTGVGGASEPSVTKTSAVMGSAEYMSPEQMMSTRDTDGRTDIWALGVILYELLTARVPFPGESITHVAALVIAHEPAPPRMLRPDIPERLEAIILHCLEKNRDYRFATVRELVQALAPFAGAGEMSSLERLSQGVSDFNAAPMPTAIIPSAPAGTRPSVSDPVQPQAYASAPLIVQAADVAVPTGGYGPSTTGVVSSDRLSLKPTRSLAPVFAVVGIAVAIGVAAVVALTHRGTGTTSAGASSTISTAGDAPMGVPTPPIAQTADASSPVIAPASASNVSPDPAASATPPKKTSSPSPSKPAQPVKAAPNCDPPFTFDAKGQKHAKPECI